jgi:hypothetical protein
MALTQPKKPVGGAFGVFANERRAGFMKACAGQKASAVSKMAGEEWKKLTAADREPYQQKYEAAKEQYEKDMAAFLESGGEKSKGLRALRSEKKAIKDGKKLKKARDADAPKRLAGGAYGRFLAEKREEIKKSLPGDHKITDVTKKASEMWKGLSESDKQKYQEMYKTAQEEYTKDLEAYRAKKKAEEPVVEETATQAKPTKAKETKSPKKRRDANDKGEKPAKGARAVATPMSKKRVAPPGVELSDVLLEKACSLGYESALKNLASRPEVVASGKPADELLKALKASNGLVNPAKRVLLGD